MAKFEGFTIKQMAKVKKLKKFKKDKAEYPKKKDRGYYCPAK